MYKKGATLLLECLQKVPRKLLKVQIDVISKHRAWKMYETVFYRVLNVFHSF